MEGRLKKGFLCGVILASFSAQAHFSSLCNGNRAAVNNANDELRALTKQNADLSNRIQLDQAAITGPMNNGKEEAEQTLAAFENSITVLSSNQTLIEQMKGLVTNLLQRHGQLVELDRALEQFTDAQPEIPLSKALARALTKAKSKMNQADVSEIAELIEELRIIEGSSMEWLKRFSELHFHRPGQDESMLVEILRSLLDSQSMTAAALMQDKALVTQWKTSLTKMTAEMEAAKLAVADKQNLISSNEQRMVSLRQSIPNLSQQLKECQNQQPDWRPN